MMKHGIVPERGGYAVYVHGLRVGFFREKHDAVDAWAAVRSCR